MPYLAGENEGEERRFRFRACSFFRKSGEERNEDVEEGGSAARQRSSARLCRGWCEHAAMESAGSCRAFEPKASAAAAPRGQSKLGAAIFAESDPCPLLVLIIGGQGRTRAGPPSKVGFFFFTTSRSGVFRRSGDRSRHSWLARCRPFWQYRGHAYFTTIQPPQGVSLPRLAPSAIVYLNNSSINPSSFL